MMIRDDLSHRGYFRPLCALVLLVTTTPAVRDGSSPEVVAAVIVRALRTHRPRTRYLIGKGHRPMTFAARWALDRILDLLRTTMLGLPTTFGEPALAREGGAP